MTERHPEYPPEIAAALARATRLEWWSVFWLLVIVAMMAAVAGGSQAFRTAWIEDMLSVLPPAFFLLARWLERREPRPMFPFGLHRAGSVAFFFSAAALFLIGALLFYEGLRTLVRAEHPTVGSVALLGHEVWLGWPMIGALILSVIPPVILGHKKRAVARQVHDKVLHTDAETNAADWQTGLAGVAGLLGIAFGLWWADALMAVLISAAILWDGLRGLGVSLVSLLDGMPRDIGSLRIDPDAQRLIEGLEKRYKDVNVQIRETGRVLRVTVEPQDAHHLPRKLAAHLLDGRGWRLLDLSVALRDDLPREGEGRDAQL